MPFVIIPKDPTFANARKASAVMGSLAMILTNAKIQQLVTRLLLDRVFNLFDT